MAVLANPAPERISPAMWAHHQRILALTGGEDSGVFANKPGYHNARDLLNRFDYSVADVPGDREGSGKWSAGEDVKLSEPKMILYTKRLDTAARNRDPRLYPAGAPPVLREFIGTKDGSSVYCYVLTGGQALGVATDAGPDYGRDDTHLWHIHLSYIRRYAANADALAGVYSVLAGEPLSSWQKPTSPVLEDDMSSQSLPIPIGYAYNAAGDVIARKNVLTVGTEPAGFAPNPIVGGKRLYLSLAADHTAAKGVGALVRVAIHNGAGYTIQTVDVHSGGRLSLAVPPAKGPTAYNISVGRVMATSDAPPSDAEIPLSLVVTVG